MSFISCVKSCWTTLPVRERPASDVGLEEELGDAALEAVVGLRGLLAAARAAEEDAAAAGAGDGREEGAEAVPAQPTRLGAVEHGRVGPLHCDQLTNLVSFDSLINQSWSK